ncbi:MAG: rhamnogalacturonan acetylesterase, partial [Armatimonadota bacterium]|nr:rhamnogalacturonan acetylesterase [Armatimonadota bacterium]
LTLGDPSKVCETTVKAEARRLILEKVATAPGQIVTRTLTVNVRRPELRSGGRVRLKHDEQTHRDWDNRLTLEFSGARQGVTSLDIARIDHAVTVYLAGDSTVTDQGQEPWCAWGQMLPRFFGAGAAIANHAESGESLRSFRSERRLDKILETIKPDDYLLIQFGHNDQKEQGVGVGAFSTYKADLEQYVSQARQHGAIPVLVTSMLRRRFDAQGKIVNSLGDYPQAVRQTAKEQRVPLIDLNAMSKTLFEALGPQGTLKAFVHYPAGTFPGQTAALKDDTHFNAYGAYELARCVVEGIKANVPALAKFLLPDLPTFDPGHPDSPDTWSLPPSPSRASATPEGS